MSSLAFTVASWNVRGLRNNKRRNAFFKIVKEEKLDIVAIQETYLDDSHFAALENKWNGTIHLQQGSAHKGGLITLFSKKFDANNIQLLCQKERFIISKCNIDNESFIICNVYAPCDSRNRTAFFDELKNEINKHGDTTVAGKLMVIGDYNCTLDKNDVVAGAYHADREMTKFKTFTNDLLLNDVWRIKNPETKQYSWSRQTPFVARRLDYVLATEFLVSTITNIYIKSLGFSDHRAIICKLELNPFPRGPSYYKLNTSLLKDPRYIEIIQTSITNCLSENKDLDAHLLWDYLKTKVVEISKQYSRSRKISIERKRKQLQEDLNMLENRMAENPKQTEIIAQISHKKEQLEIHTLEQTRGAQIRAGIKWIEEGEKNSKFFLSLEKERAKGNMITQLSHGEENLTDPTKILNKIKAFYEDLYKNNKGTQEITEGVEKLVNNLDIPKLDDEEKEACESQLHEKEIRDAINSMKNGSSPGLDGLPVEFYKTFWTSIKEPFVKALRYSAEVGHLSFTQRQGIVSLIHKGKERENLNNWRPITLTNVDYKIIAKIFAIRLRKVISKIIHKNQRGFIPGRNMTDMLREIDDIIETGRNNKTNHTLLSLDFRKAFDTISIQYLLEAFKIFGFGPNFASWLEILMRDRLTCFKNAGFISSNIKMERGVRQGCPLSPLIFVIGVEILGLCIRQSPNIKGIILGEGMENIKIKQYADDTTLFLSDNEDLRQAMELIEHFTEISGLELNKSKSLAMKLKGSPDNAPIYEDIASTDEIKILGIYFRNDIPVSKVAKNWESRIDKITRLLNLWTKRNLSIVGKIIILKTFIMSQLTYLMQSCYIPKEVLEELNRMFFRFIWRKKFTNRRAYEKVKRSVMKSSIGKGGLNMINIQDSQDAFILSRIEKIVGSSDKSEQKLPADFLAPVGGLSIFMNFTNNKNFQGRDLIKSDFWRHALGVWLYHNEPCELSSTTIINQPIFNNQNITYNKKNIFCPSAIKKGIFSVKDICNGGSLISLDEFRQKFGHSPSLTLEYWLMSNAIPRDKLQRDQADIQGIMFKGIPLGDIGRKKFLALIRKEECAHSQNFWKRKLDISQFNETRWMIARECTTETRLRVLHWKILHNIYPTSILLNRMGIRESNRCQSCQEVDYVEHFFVDCKEVTKLWQDIERRFALKWGFRVALNKENILLGFSETSGINKLSRQQGNKIILIAKMVISKWKYGPGGDMKVMFEFEINIRGIDF